MSPILTSPPCRPSIGVLIAWPSTGSALTAKPAARQAATKPRRSTRTSGTRLLRSSFCRSLRGFSIGAPWAYSSLGLVEIGPALPDAGSGFESVRELQHREVLAIAADDLQPHRQSVGRESGRYRDRGVTGDGDVVAALHPVEVVVELRSVDLARPFHLGGKR